MNLYIDTTKYNLATFVLSAKGKIVQKTYTLNPHEGYKILKKLDEFLKKGRGWKGEGGIMKIVVNKGPGSFVGTRVGVAIAQALSLAWGIPVKFIADSKFNIH